MTERERLKEKLERLRRECPEEFEHAMYLLDLIKRDRKATRRGRWPKKPTVK